MADQARKEALSHVVSPMLLLKKALPHAVGLEVYQVALLVTPMAHRVFYFEPLCQPSTVQQPPFHLPTSHHTSTTPSQDSVHHSTVISRTCSMSLSVTVLLFPQHMALWIPKAEVGFLTTTPPRLQGASAKVVQESHTTIGGKMACSHVRWRPDDEASAGVGERDLAFRTTWPEQTSLSIGLRPVFVLACTLDCNHASCFSSCLSAAHIDWLCLCRRTAFCELLSQRTACPPRDTSHFGDGEAALASCLTPRWASSSGSTVSRRFRSTLTPLKHPRRTPLVVLCAHVSVPEACLIQACLFKIF